MRLLCANSQKALSRNGRKEREGTDHAFKKCLTSTVTFVWIVDRWAEFKIAMPLVNPFNVCIPYIKWLGD